jgi:site-specific recombinase XerC
VSNRKVILKWRDIEMAELDLVKLISHFAQSNKAESKSPKTVEWYTEMNIHFISFLRCTGRRAILAELNAATVRELVVREQGRSLSPYTVQGGVRALKAFSSWLFSSARLRYVMSRTTAMVARLPLYRMIREDISTSYCQTT